MGFFRKDTTTTVVYALPEKDVMDITRAIKEERLVAQSRQKDPHAAPSAYMKGLDFALKVIAAHPMYQMEVK